MRKKLTVILIVAFLFTLSASNIQAQEDIKIKSKIACKKFLSTLGFNFNFVEGMRVDPSSEYSGKGNELYGEVVIESNTGDIEIEFYGKDNANKGEFSIRNLKDTMNPDFTINDAEKRRITLPNVKVDQFGVIFLYKSRTKQKVYIKIRNNKYIFNITAYCYNNINCMLEDILKKNVAVVNVSAF